MILSNMAWYLLVIASAITGVLLSANYGLMGLVVFIALSIFICFICPSTLSESSDKFPKGDVGFLWAIGLSFLSVLIFGFLIWLFVGKEDVAKYIIALSHFGIVSPDTKELASYIIDPTSAKIGKEVASEIDLWPRWCLGFASARVFTYLLLPIVIAATSLNHVQWARWCVETKKNSGKSVYAKVYGGELGVLGSLFLFALLLGILWMGDAITSAPHIWISQAYNAWLLPPAFIVIFWLVWVAVYRKILVLVFEYGGRYV